MLYDHDTVHYTLRSYDNAIIYKEDKTTFKSVDIIHEKRHIFSCMSNEYNCEDISEEHYTYSPNDIYLTSQCTTIDMIIKDKIKFNDPFNVKILVKKFNHQGDAILKLIIFFVDEVNKSLCTSENKIYNLGYGIQDFDVNFDLKQHNSQRISYISVIYRLYDNYLNILKIGSKNVISRKYKLNLSIKKSEIDKIGKKLYFCYENITDQILSFLKIHLLFDKDEDKTCYRLNVPPFSCTHFTFRYQKKVIIFYI